MIYVCSDIHGHYDMYLRMLDLINFSDDDTLYIIGDVIDRGPYPVPLLLDVLKRKNVILMMGNHEHMMVQGMWYDSDDDYNDWMYNGGEVTLRQLEELECKERKYIFEELEKCPLIIPGLEVNGHRFYLAHASHALYPEKEVLLYKDAGEQNRDRILWNRDYRNIDRERLTYAYRRLYAEYGKTTLLIGHTPVHRCSYGVITSNGYCRISKARGGHLINLDCGCAAGITLGVLRLDDMCEFYVDNRSLNHVFQKNFSQHIPKLSRKEKF